MNPVQEHYDFEHLSQRFDQILTAACLGTGRLEWSQLAAIDQFHVRGLEATKELATALDLKSGNRVLDVGCGFGGPARYLAAVHDCMVTGIDLTPTYIEVAKIFAERCGLSDWLNFKVADALELPFGPEKFDHAWTQHVAMNISDKVSLYAGIHRVLRPGGRLAIYDVVRGKEAPVIYPVPWASEESISFLASPEEVHDHLTTAGFKIVSSTNTTQQGLGWFTKFRSATKDSGANDFNLNAVLGPNGTELTTNVGKNLAEGRIELLQLIAEKA